MDRRAFLTNSSAKKKPAPVHSSFRTLSGIAPYTGSWTTNEVIHLLKRTMFGAKKADVDFFSAMTMSASVDYLLNVSPAQTSPPPPIKSFDSAVDTAVATGQTWVNTAPVDSNANKPRRESLKNWWVGLMVNQERNILEKLTLLWHNHFVVEMTDVGNAIYCYQYNDMLRKNALGNFKDFVKAVTINTAMLKYLNNYLNINSAPDENYARELQELFTIGKGADNANAPYSEENVKQAAKVLTGWAINSSAMAYQFNVNKHDTGNKQFSAFYNNTLITGRTGTDGMLELDDLLTMIFSKDDVSLTICRKLYRWFVYYDIDATTEQNVIAPLAQIFRNSNYEIKPVLSALFKSEHFFDAANQGCVIKNPLDMLVGHCRESNVVFPDVADYTSNYYMWAFINSTVTKMQMELGDPPNVAGWPAYYQQPQFHELWINSDSLPKRNEFSDLMTSTGYSKNGKKLLMDVLAFTSAMPSPQNPNALVSDAITYLLRMPLTQQSRDKIKTDILLGGQANDNYWTTAWNMYVAVPTDTANTNIVTTKLKSLYQYIMRLPEYQLS